MSNMIDEKIEKDIQQFLDQELEKRLKHVQIDLLKEIFLTRDEFKKEMERIHARFEAMQSQIDKRFDIVYKRFEAMQNQIDKRFDIVYKRFDEFALDFDTAIEKVGYSIIKDSLESEGITTFPQLRAHFIDQDHEVYAATTDVEIDLFSADIPLIGECTLKIMNMDKLDIFLRKINFVEKRYQKNFRRFIFTLNISPSIKADVEKFCQQWSIKLISS
jgi:hypothetical protein